MTKHFMLSLLACSVLMTACQDKQAATAETPAATEQAQDTAAAGKPDLSAETAAYRAWVESEIGQLVDGTEKFVAALKAGNVEEAKALYPHVRMHFERSEPIAESFGDLDPRIDNREADLAEGETWTGFHAIEKILWTQNTTEGTDKLADQLLADVKELHAKISTVEVTGDLMVQGSVDLLNEVTTSKITGEEDIFSKTDLYDFKANVEGAQKIFEILTPKIEAKDPALVKTLTERFAAVNDLLAKYQVSDGEYKPYNELTSDDTKALAESVNKLGEPLAQMGIVLE
ncbi:iron uptake system protein EfeO [Moraxella marmotae]|uniref:iron uptake system protein EfeO n=1 Tax=Moraxella marmotae TaxID=3344520 RepID=UPI0035F4A742